MNHLASFATRGALRLQPPSLSKMWNALKSDLLDFVSTIKEDTAKALSSATGAEADEEETIVALRLKQLQDVKRSYDTFSLAVEDAGFAKFTRNFSLSTYAAEIAQLLDDEPDVARYYAELVPVQISPEQFWARCFFRLSVVSRGGVMLDDEEEDLEWETTDASIPAREGPREGDLLDRVKELEAENMELKAHVKALVSRVAELENMGSTSGNEKGGAQERGVQASVPTPSPSPSPASSPSPVPSPSPAPAPSPSPVEQPASSPLPDDTEGVLVGKSPKIKDLANLDEDEDEDWGE